MLVGVAARLGERIRGNLADCDDGRVADRQPMPVACRMAVARAGLKPGLTEHGDQIEVVVVVLFANRFNLTLLGTLGKCWFNCLKNLDEIGVILIGNELLLPHAADDFLFDINNFLFDITPNMDKDWK